MNRLHGMAAVALFQILHQPRQPSPRQFYRLHEIPFIVLLTPLVVIHGMLT